MIIISHRGNLDGAQKETENSPEQILMALSNGFDVEIDCWVVDKKIFTGHDYGQYRIDLNFLNRIKDKVWIHCKNLESLIYFSQTDFNYFWHESDQYTLTSKKHIWTYPGTRYGYNSIIVDLKLDFISKNDNSPLGICTDYPKNAFKKFN